MQKKEYIIRGRRWWLQKTLPTSYLWVSDYWCADGDPIRLFINKDMSGFELACFSGIPSSSIKIDEVDFGVFWKNKEFYNKYNLYSISNNYEKNPFDHQCVVISDFLSRKFCEYKEINTYEKL